jgi:hypothetical protein
MTSKTIGEFRRMGQDTQPTLAEIVASRIKSARGAFGHEEGRTDIECLALASLCMSKIIEERTKDNTRLLVQLLEARDPSKVVVVCGDA